VPSSDRFLGGDPIRRPPANIRNPRCFLVYALAPESVSTAEANQAFNAFVADRDLPLVLFHDHFIGDAGGVAIFYAETAGEREALLSQHRLTGWDVEIRPLIYARSPAAFDEQAAFTLRAYRGLDWDSLRQSKRPSYGSPSREAETASEDIDDS
jgi:hypothetical protein